MMKFKRVLSVLLAALTVAVNASGAATCGVRGGGRRHAASLACRGFSEAR